MRARFLLPRPTVSRPEPAGGTIPTLIMASGVVFVGLLAWSRLSGHSLSPATWYLTRAAGLTLYVTLWATVVLGLGLTTRAMTHRGASRAVIYSLHHYLTGLSYGFLGLHLISLAADPYTHYSWVELLIPFRNPWREPWTGLGVIGAWLTVVLGGSFVFRRLTGFRAWRALHWLTFGLYVLALAHGIGSGSDSGAWWARLLYAGTAGAVVALLARRIAHGRRSETPLPAPTSVPYDRFAPQPRPARQPAATTLAFARQRPAIMPDRTQIAPRGLAPATATAPPRMVLPQLPDAAFSLDRVPRPAEQDARDADPAWVRPEPWGRAPIVRHARRDDGDVRRSRAEGRRSR